MDPLKRTGLSVYTMSSAVGRELDTDTRRDPVQHLRLWQYFIISGVCVYGARSWWSNENRCVCVCVCVCVYVCVWEQGVCEKQEEAGESHWASRLHYIWVIVFRSSVAPEQQVGEYLGFYCDAATGPALLGYLSHYNACLRCKNRPH